MSVAAALPGLSVPALEAHLREVLPGLLHGPLSAELVAGGRSNLTYVLTDGADRWVLCPPLSVTCSSLHTTWWDGSRGLDSPVAAVPCDVPGLPASEQLTARYAERTGRDLGEMP